MILYNIFALCLIFCFFSNSSADKSLAPSPSITCLYCHNEERNCVRKRLKLCHEGCAMILVIKNNFQYSWFGCSESLPFGFQPYAEYLPLMKKYDHFFNQLDDIVLGFHRCKYSECIPNYEYSMLRSKYSIMPSNMLPFQCLKSTQLSLFRFGPFDCLRCNSQYANCTLLEPATCKFGCAGVIRRSNNQMGRWYGCIEDMKITKYSFVKSIPKKTNFHFNILQIENETLAVFRCFTSYCTNDLMVKYRNLFDPTYLSYLLPLTCNPIPPSPVLVFVSSSLNSPIPYIAIAFIFCTVPFIYYTIQVAIEDIVTRCLRKSLTTIQAVIEDPPSTSNPDDQTVCPIYFISD